MTLAVSASVAQMTPGQPMGRYATATYTAVADDLLGQTKMLSGVRLYEQCRQPDAGERFEVRRTNGAWRVFDKLEREWLTGRFSNPSQAADLASIHHEHWQHLK